MAPGLDLGGSGAPNGDDLDGGSGPGSVEDEGRSGGGREEEGEARDGKDVNELRERERGVEGRQGETLVQGRVLGQQPRLGVGPGEPGEGFGWEGLGESYVRARRLRGGEGTGRRERIKRRRLEGVDLEGREESKSRSNGLSALEELPVGGPVVLLVRLVPLAQEGLELVGAEAVEERGGKGVGRVHLLPRGGQPALRPVQLPLIVLNAGG